ncbi:low temperature requirement protein A [Micromonospora sp. MS34]|uniref:low temperature requirement protein A n=1 Tax=Micromonospora sp. MS34 TaxID=3385971 RepID=UPI00399F33BA
MGNGVGGRWPNLVQRAAPGSRTTRLELFFDLVFVFAFINVTSLTATDPTPLKLYRGLLVLALLWWCWTGFARAGNAVRGDQGLLPVIGFVTVTATFLLVLSIPGSFVDTPGGLYGPLVFAGCYFVIRAVQLTVFAWVDWGDPVRRRSLLPRAALPVTSTALLVAAGTVPQRLSDQTLAVVVQLALWTVALLVEYVGGVTLGRSWWVVLSAGHWAERHALMVLIALGESIIALGLGARFFTQLPLTLPVVVGAVLAIMVIATLWWAYFDTLAAAIEQTLHHARDPATRLRLTRDVYTFLHLPMIAGIIFFALTLKDLLAEAAQAGSPPWGVPLGGFWVSVFYGGVALYLLSIAGCAFLALHVVRRPLVVAVLVLVVAAPPAALLPELVALGLLAVITLVAVAAETMSEKGLRRRARRLALEEQRAAEVDLSRWRRRHL